MVGESTGCCEYPTPPMRSGGIQYIRRGGGGSIGQRCMISERNHEERHSPPQKDGHSATCICGWGDKCPELRLRLDKLKHKLQGLVRIKLDTSHPNFRPFFSALFINLDVPTDIQQIILDGDPAHLWTDSRGRVPISRLHWTEAMMNFLAESQQHWLTAISLEEAKNCLYAEDNRLRVKGGWLKVPNIPEPAVRALVETAEAAAASVDIPPRSELISNHERHKQKQQREDQQRSPEEWRRILDDAEQSRRSLKRKYDVAMSNNNNLSAEVTRLRKVLSKKEEYQRKKKRKSVHFGPPTGEDGLSWPEFFELMKKWGGLSRFTLLNDDWHKKNPDAAMILFGLGQTWAHAKAYVKAIFPHLDMSPPALHNTKGGPDLLPLSPYEKCMLTKVVFRRRFTQGIMAMIHGTDRRTMGRALFEWAPLWGKAGEQMSILDIFYGFLYSEQPEFAIVRRLGDTVQLDGTDVATDAKRNDASVHRNQYTPKGGYDASRWVTWTTNCCLTWEHTPAYTGRASEKQLHRQHGSLGRAYAPVEKWKNAAENMPRRPFAQEVATDNMLELKDVMNKVATHLLDNDGAVDDGVTETAAPSGLAGAGIKLRRTKRPSEHGMDVDVNTDLESNDEDEEEAESAAAAGIGSMPGGGSASEAASATADNGHSSGGGSGPSTPASSAAATAAAAATSLLDMASVSARTDPIAAADAFFEIRLQQIEVAKKTKKDAPFLSVELLRKQNENALIGGVNSSGHEKLAQLELHERLHRAYENADIPRCPLSYFLLCSKDRRHKLLAWLGSDMASCPCPSSPNSLPKIPLRLHKIPASIREMGDKGFNHISRDLPLFNEVVTPWRLEAGKGYRKSAEQIKDDRPKFAVRSGAERAFACSSKETGINPTIPYWFVPLVPYVQNWGHALININKPFRKPGRYSVVGSDYWNDKKEYTLKHENYLTYCVD